MKAAIEGRYRLLPYIYTQFRRYAETGMPVLRSLALQCFTNKDTYWRGAEYFFGDHLYVIPIHEPQEGGRFLYIPEGVWYSYHTDSLMEDTGKDVWVKCPLSFLPVYVRGGAVIPHWPVQQYVGELPRPPLTLDVWWSPEGEVASHLYEDAGDGYAYRNGECAVHEFLTAAAPVPWSWIGTAKGIPVRSMSPQRWLCTVCLRGFPSAHVWTAFLAAA